MRSGDARLVRRHDRIEPHVAAAGDGTTGQFSRAGGDHAQPVAAVPQGLEHVHSVRPWLQRVPGGEEFGCSIGWEARIDGGRGEQVLVGPRGAAGLGQQLQMAASPATAGVLAAGGDAPEGPAVQEGGEEVEDDRAGGHLCSSACATAGESINNKHADAVDLWPLERLCELGLLNLF
ncbi:hypothetical protein VTN02DRAFT_1665 [Thermoascus thermophilus]